MSYGVDQAIMLITKINMYFCLIDEQSYAIKPMNCPGAILSIRIDHDSYRELPLNYAEFGHVHRHELSGVLHGLLRVRAFTQDDAHIFCTIRSAEEEITTMSLQCFRCLKNLDLQYSASHFNTTRKIILEAMSSGKKQRTH